MQHFYDGQIRRYITQIVRLMSGFTYKTNDGTISSIPVMYGDITRQVANIIRENSENKLPSVPRISVYVTNLEMDRSRSSDATFVSKMNIRERAYDSDNNEYLNTQGKNYTIERPMPSPYTLGVAVDIWTSNTDQKLQILEQILMLFNPSLEIQTTDNYVDWTSLSVVNLDRVNFSNRTIPVGVDSEIDVSSLEFSTPIYISLPVKVKKLGVVTNIIANIFNEATGDIDLGKSMPELSAYSDTPHPIEKVADENLDTTTRVDDVTSNRVTTSTTFRDYGVYILGNTAQLVDGRDVGTHNWREVIEAYPGQYVADVSKITLRKDNTDSLIVGTFTLNAVNETKLTINWDTDTLPTGDVIEGPARSSNSLTSIDKIIDPYNYNPTNDKTDGFRVLILDDINPSDNVGQNVGDTPYNFAYDGPDAWKNDDGTDFVAGKNDIIEWDGAKWHVVFDASATTTSTNTQNLTTNIIYKWTGNEWIQAYEGEYSHGNWNIQLGG
jgi:hypothetical protein